MHLIIFCIYCEFEHNVWKPGRGALRISGVAFYTSAKELLMPNWLIESKQVPVLSLDLTFL